MKRLPNSIIKKLKNDKKIGYNVFSDHLNVCLIDKFLTRDEAIKKYGEITDEEYGTRGGWKSVTFGETKFNHKLLKIFP